jgi:hypothetical protein
MAEGLHDAWLLLMFSFFFFSSPNSVSTLTTPHTGQGVSCRCNFVSFWVSIIFWGWARIFWGFCECLVDTSISWYIYVYCLSILSTTVNGFVVNTVSVLFMVCKWFVVSKMIVYTYHMAMKWWVSCIQHGRVWKWRENRPMVIKE